MKPSEVKDFIGKKIKVYADNGQTLTGKISYFINEGFEDNPDDWEDQFIIIGRQSIHMHSIVKIEVL